MRGGEIIVDSAALARLLRLASLGADTQMAAAVAALVTRSRPAPPDRPMNIEETAAYLGVHERTVRRRIADGTLPHRRLGRRVLIDRGDLISPGRTGQERAEADNPLASGRPPIDAAHVPQGMGRGGPPPTPDGGPPTHKGQQ